MNLGIIRERAEEIVEIPYLDAGNFIDLKSDEEARKRINSTSIHSRLRKITKI